MQVDTVKRITKKTKKAAFIANVLVQRTSLQLCNRHHQMNFAIQMIYEWFVV